MKQGSEDKSILFKCCFVLGIILYLSGLFLLFVSVFKSSKIISMFGSTNSVTVFRIISVVAFAIGFFLFLIGLIYYYKSNKIFEQNKDLIVEGKADMITIMIMTYMMIFMVIICIILDELIGALLFGICIVVQSIVNMILIKYFGGNR